MGSPTDAKDDDKLYFVKHRYGVKGKSVYVYNKTQLQDWWERSATNREDFVIQEEVQTALDEEGRKFVLRCHVLVYQRTTGGGPLRAFLHGDVITMTHAVPYSRTSSSKAVHVSQAGKRRGHHPKPRLVTDLDPDHPAHGSLEALAEACRILVVRAPFPPPTAAGGLTCFALLGLDCLVVEDGRRIVVCEANSHPALGWGTMSDVDGSVFRKLIEDTLAILLLGRSPDDTGFIALL